MLLGIEPHYFEAAKSVTEAAGGSACLFYNAVNREVKSGMVNVIR